MKFLVINTDYQAFLRWLYSVNPGLGSMTFADQERARVDSLFSVADFYTRNLRKLGHEAFDVWANNEPMQKAWARENNVRVPRDAVRLKLGRRRRVAWPSLSRGRGWFYRVLAAQIESYRPDVLLNQDVATIGPDFLDGIKANVGLLVGQHAATPLPDADYSCYDLFISSFLPMVGELRERGYLAELHRLGFESDLVEEIPAGDRDLDVTFVGSLQSVHSSRASFLDVLCEQVPDISLFAPSADRLPESCAARRAYVGEAWGRDMYRVLGRSKVTVNHLGDVAPYSNNLRLYEATGMGTLLLTQQTPNLAELFSVEEELAAYTSAHHCAQLIRHYLSHSAERERMADAGRRRTISDHTWLGRMRELIEIVETHL